MTAAAIRYWSLGAAWLLLPACADPPPKDEAGPAPVSLFDEVTESLGLDFRHRVEAGNGFFMPDIVGSGGALEDFDGDGDLDLYLVNSGSRRGPSPAGANRLFRREADGSFRESPGSGAEDEWTGGVLHGRQRVEQHRRQRTPKTPRSRSAPRWAVP